MTISCYNLKKLIFFVIGNDSRNALSDTERLLVRGHRVPYVEQEVADEKTPLSGISLHTNYLLWVIIGLVITTIFILVLYLKEKKLQKEKNETS